MPTPNEPPKCVECDNSPKGKHMELHGETYCEPCYDDNVSSCGDCCKDDHIENLYYLERYDDMICELCIESNYTSCPDCDEYCRDDETYFVNEGLGRGYNVCESCFENGSYLFCHSCDELWEWDDMYMYNGEHYCQSCHQENKAQIHYYNYEPNELNFHHIKNGVSCFTSNKPLTKKTMYLGVELEIDSFEEISTKNECSKETAKDETLFFNKEDGSLDYGFEIVSHPFTMDYFRANKARFHKRIKTALKHGFRSHDVKTCGMHIHVSKDALSNLDIFKIVHFMYSNVDFIKIISNRTWGQLQQWCSLDINALISGMSDPSQKVERICKVAKRKGGTPKYVGLNLAKDKTIEFRIFRGTLNWSTYQKNIQFVDALINWIKSTSLEEIQSDFAILSFMNFLCKNQTNYNHLILFIFNKFYAFDVRDKKTPPLRNIFKHFDLLSMMNNKQLMKKRSI